MASEDSDEVVPGFAPVHRLSDLSDLDETASAQMTAVGDQLDTPHELLEVLLLRGPHRMLLEERDYRSQEIDAASHDESVQVLVVVVVSDDSPRPCPPRRTPGDREDTLRSRRLA